jgi:outer membrane protein
MKIRMVVPVVAALLMTPAVWAQAGGGTAAEMKVGVINIQAAIANTAEGRQANAELQSQFAPRQSELTDLQKQIQDIRNRLQTGQTTLSDEETARLTDQGNRLTRTLQRKQQDLQADFSDASQDAVSTIGQKMLPILDKYARDHGFSLVLDTSSQQTAVIYAASQIDITQEIVRLYDEAHPVKATSAPSRSGTAPRTPTKK